MSKQSEMYQELYGYASGLGDIISTHSHYLLTENEDGETLHGLLQKTYISWSYPGFPDTAMERERYIRTMCTNTYFQWMAKSLGTLYGDGSPLTVDNWDSIDEEYRKACNDPGHSFGILSKTCRYGAVILDKYDDPGNDLGHPELMRPAFRCDAFLHGYSLDGHDENNNFPYKMLGLDSKPKSPEEYIRAVEDKIVAMKARGCVALKFAIAYERDLCFENTSIETARAAYDSPEPSSSEIHDFGDYMMFAICRIAGIHDITVQIHTGLGKLDGSGAIGLRKLIDSNPHTRFSLFHCGYPWMDDVLGLLHNYRNVYPDLCWLPLISSSAAVRFIREALEVGDTTRLTWGCDTWTSQESFGALLAVRHCLAAALENMCRDSLLTIAQAKEVISSVLCNNAKTLYGIQIK